MSNNNTKLYRFYFLKFMSYLKFENETSYQNDPEHEFTQDELLQIKPGDLCRYLSFKCYGTPDPTENDKPDHARSSTLEYIKKAISHFMPRKAIQWDPVVERGNPTRSEEVHAFLKKIRKCEVRKQGKASQARRPLEFDEFLNLLDIIQSSNPTRQSERVKKYLMASVLTMQWQLIGRINDMMKLKLENLQVGINNYTLTCQMRWSKNISEEREAPTQIILGSMDPRICPLLNLAAYLEVVGREHGHVMGEFAYDNQIDGQRNTCQQLVGLLESDKFKKLKEGNLGTHSIRKGATTYASRCGQSKDAVERRGRWRKRGRIVDIYIDVTLTYPDACTAAVLCGPRGACKYRIRQGISLTERHLTELVARETNKIVPNRVALVLALPLLWAAFDDSISETPRYLPTELTDEILSDLANAGFDFRGSNPVERIPIYPSGNGADLNLIELTGGDSTTASSSETPASSTDIRQNAAYHDVQRIAILASQMNMLQRRMEEINTNLVNELLKMHSKIDRYSQNINNSVKRIALQPVVRRAAAAGTGDGPNSSGSRRVDVKLSRCPKDLHTLWQEYEHGLGHTKPAKDFTARERGANKFAFSRRKTFWDLVIHLVRLNYTSDTAIDYIYHTYGRALPVTKILLKLRKDRSTGSNPAFGKW